jgi:transcriptional regulator with XRE-family HTH domain
MRLEDFRIEVAKLTRQQLSSLSDVGMSTIQRAERGERISRLMRARILDGLSKHLGRPVTKDEIDEFKDSSQSDDT